MNVAIIGFATMWVASPAASAAPRPDQQRCVIETAGRGRPPASMQGARARLMARRAAEVVAVRNLAKKLGLRDSTRLRGFRYKDRTVHVDGSVTVTAEIRWDCHPVRPAQNGAGSPACKSLTGEQRCPKRAPKPVEQPLRKLRKQ